MDDKNQSGGNELLNLPELKEVALSTPHAISSLAMNFAMKFHDINTVQEGALYQQMKLEGKNLSPLFLEYVFETAARIELWLMRSPNRLSEALLNEFADAVEAVLEEDALAPEPGEEDEAPA